MLIESQGPIVLGARLVGEPTELWLSSRSMVTMLFGTLLSNVFQTMVSRVRAINIKSFVYVVVF